MKVNFCFQYPRNFLGRIVSWFTWSSYSHVFVRHNGFIYESYPFIGVRVIPDETRNDVEFDVLEIDVDNNFLSFFINRVGLGYDYGGIFGFIFRKHWDDGKRWFCSEIIAAALKESGCDVVKRPKHRITPGNLYYSVLVYKEGLKDGIS